MSFATVRQFLAYAADEFAPQIFETDRYKSAVTAALDGTGRWQQRECPLKAPLVVWLVLAGVFHRAWSLASILKMMLAQYRLHCPDLSLRAVTPEAACKARARLGHEPLAAVFEHLCADVRGTASFHGLRVWSVDGTFLNMPDTPENDVEFGRVTASRGTTAYPQLHLTQLTDTVTRELRNVVIGRSDKVDERRDALVLINALGAGDLLLMDCGFSAAWFFRKCRNRKIRIVARISNCWKPRILKTYGDGDYLVRISGNIPTAYQGSTSSAVLKMRMIVYQVGNDEPVRLLTSLVDPEQCPASEIAVLYHKRWESELSYDEQKVHLSPLQHGKQKTVFRSKAPDGVRQEAYGLLIAYNLVRGLMSEAATTTNVDPRHLSFVETLRLIDLATMAYQRARTLRERMAVRKQLVQDIAETLDRRPRRPRHYPRVVKIKMSNYGCKKATDCGCHRDYVNELMPALIDDHTHWRKPKHAAPSTGGRGA